jgi:tetratricopeptide (TPR) repeat protein
MLDLGDIQVDLDRHRVLGPGGEESLTQLEVDVLRYLLERPGQVVARENLEREVWGFRAGTRSEAVPVAMRRLRKKLGDLLVTVRSSGWRLEGREVLPSTSPVAVPATPFVGREAELTELSRRFLTWRLVTLRGPGGVGKTRIGLAFAQRWPGEVVVVSLLGLPPDGLRVRLADTLGLRDATSAALHTRLRDRPTLLLLDDGDEIAGPAAEVLQELLAIPGPKVLVTRRAPLGLREEAVMEIAPFGADLARSFLIERLRAVHPDPDPAGVDELVGLLDGLPGAMELYAGRAVFGLQPLIEELRAGSPDPTLVASVSRSWDQLGDDDRRVLLACSAFAGPFPPAAALVAGSREALARLRQRSLLQLDGRGDLFLLGHVRRFCEARAGAERLPAWRWVIGEAQRAVETLHVEPRASLGRLRALRSHLLEVVRLGPDALAIEALLPTLTEIRWSGPISLGVQLGRAELPGAPVALQDALQVHLGWALLMSEGRPPEVLAMIAGIAGPDAMLLRAAVLLANGRVDDALAQLQRLIEEAPGTWYEAIARVRRCGSQIAISRLSPAEVDADLARALEICEDQRLYLFLPEAWRAAASVAMWRGQTATARGYLTQALDVARARGLGLVHGALWNTLGSAWFLEDLAAAESCFLQAREACLQRGASDLLSLVEVNIAMVLVLTGRPAEALQVLEPALLAPRPLVRQVAGLFRAAALFGLRRDPEARAALDALQPEVLGGAGGGDALAQGLALIALVRLEPLLREPGRHRVALQAALDQVAEQRAEIGATTLQGLALRVESALKEG